MENQSATSHEHIPSEEHALTQTQLSDDSLAVSITKMLEGLSPLSPNCCIYRVNFDLLEANPEVYTPKVVSIGPLHRGNKKLQTMEEHKLRYLQTFLHFANLSIEDSVNHVRILEGEARSCYAETIEQTDDEFGKMILVDGCFVVMVLMFQHFPQLIQRGDGLFDKPRLIKRVRIDMALLENQLPFFVIDWLYNLLISSANQRELVLERPSIRNLVYEFFKPVIPVNKPPKDNDFPQISHFVDFIRFFYLPTRTTLEPISEAIADTEAIASIPNVMNLRAAGVMFESVTGSSPVDIDFVGQVFKIPHLILGGNTETIFRNLLAFEQLHLLDEYITAYLFFLHKLIGTPLDVDFLVQHGVLRNMLQNNEDACILFSNITKNVSIDSMPPYFSCVCKNLNDYYETSFHRWTTVLKRDYFNTPWMVMGVMAEFILLVLTFIQTLCSLWSSWVPNTRKT